MYETLLYKSVHSVVCLRTCNELTATLSFMNKHDFCIIAYFQCQAVCPVSSHFFLSMVRPLISTVAHIGRLNWAVDSEWWSTSTYVSSMPSELQPRCLIIQVLKRLRSARAFGDGSKVQWKLANSFCMGVVSAKTVVLTRSLRWSPSSHAHCSYDIDTIAPYGAIILSMAMIVEV